MKNLLKRNKKLGIRQFTRSDDEDVDNETEMKEDMCLCGRYHFNKNCRHKECKICCVARSVYCAMTFHVPIKPFQKADTHESPKIKWSIITEMSNTIEKESLIWISYDGGTIPLTPSKIRPTCCLKDPLPI